MPARNVELPPKLAALWVLVEEAKSLLQCSHTTLYRLVREKEIRAAKYQGRAVFGRKSIERYLSTWTREEERLLAIGSR